jgi:hypothetical protein
VKVETASAGATPMQNFDHFILTRFNVRVEYAPFETRLDPTWFRHRFDLFDRFCFPSVREQSTRNFRWLVLFSATPSIFKEKIAEYSRWASFIPVYMSASDEERRKITREVIKNHLSEGVQRLVTTRLDNDDALHSRFIEKLQQIESTKGVTALNSSISRAAMCGTARVLNSIYPSRKATHSLVSSSRCMSLGQCIVASSMSVVRWPRFEVLTTPLWLQVIHEGNVINRVRGVRVPAAALSNFRTIGPVPAKYDWVSCWVELAHDILKRVLRRIARLCGIN